MEPIPVVPTVHFSCGGIKVDLWGKTEIDRLFAVGEVSCTGLHGANRLASTSLLEGLVWGNRAARWIDRHWRAYRGSGSAYAIPEWIDTGVEEPDPALIKQDLITLRHIMWNYVGLVRTERRLKRAITDLRHLWQGVEEFYKHAKLSRELLELRNGIQTALVIARTALANPVSRGCHYRKD
jgi:L-aspartate oxidase